MDWLFNLSEPGRAVLAWVLLLFVVILFAVEMHLHDKREARERNRFENEINDFFPGE